MCSKEKRMKYVITAEEMKRADEATMQFYGVPSCVLMERAALKVRETIRRITPEACGVLIVCGTGNNGGDGMALARMLVQDGDRVDLVLAGDRKKASEEAARQLSILDAYGIPVLDTIPEGTYDWVVDAIFGISLSRDVGGTYAQLVTQMNALGGHKLAVDISTGIAADTGQIMGVAFRADYTVTMAYAKYGQLLYPGRLYTGELIIAQIGITDESFRMQMPAGCFCEPGDLSRIPARRPDTNKGSYGKLLSVTGSENMAGAAYFASLAAYRTGAGLVYIETPEVNRAILQTLLPEAVLYTYWSGSAARLRDHAQGMTAAICGCGIGTGDDSRSVLLTLLRYTDLPLVLDADALNLIAADERISEAACAYPGAKILTPHVGEAARLLRCQISEIKADPIAAAQMIAASYGCICVLKDAVTVICDADRICLNTSGNNAMSKGGSGDVLTGVIGALLAQGADPWTASSVGVYLHGLAGEKVSERTGSYSLLARELTDGITEILREVGDGYVS